MDLVICTHLHVDHVGWNTRLDNGRWVPTFPHARHLFARIEWEHRSSEREQNTCRIMADSVEPVLDAGLATLLEVDHRVSDKPWLEPTYDCCARHALQPPDRGSDPAPRRRLALRRARLRHRSREGG